jgi:hypothetical protein
MAILKLVTRFTVLNLLVTAIVIAAGHAIFYLTA